MEQRGRKLDSFKELIKKAVNAKAKAALRPRSYARKTDQHCLQSSWPSTAKASIQSQPMKGPRFKKPKSKPQKLKAPALQRFNNAETSEKAQNEKKKNDWKHWQSRRSDNESSRATAATRGNTTNNSAKGSRTQKDVSQIMYYNCNKKRHYATKCPKPPKSKKLVPVSATSVSVTEASKEAQKVILDRVPYLHYPVQFQKEKGASIQALINLGSKVNTMTLAYAKQLGLQVRKTDVGAQKINGSLLRTFGMVITGF